MRPSIVVWRELLSIIHHHRPKKRYEKRLEGRLYHEAAKISQGTKHEDREGAVRACVFAQVRGFVVRTLPPT